MKNEDLNFLKSASNHRTIKNNPIISPVRAIKNCEASITIEHKRTKFDDSNFILLQIIPATIQNAVNKERLAPPAAAKPLRRQSTAM